MNPVGSKIIIKDVMIDGKFVSKREHEALLLEMNPLLNDLDMAFDSKNESKLTLKGNAFTYKVPNTFVTGCDAGIGKTAKAINDRHVYEIKKNTFRPHTYNFFLRAVVKVAAFIVSIVALPFYLLGKLCVGIYITFIATQHKLPIARDIAKNAEEQKKFEGLAKACKALIGNNRLNFINKIETLNDLTRLETYLNKTTRHIIRILANHGVAIDSLKINEVELALENLESKHFNDQQSLKNAIIQKLPELDGILDENQTSLILKELELPKDLEKALKEDLSKFDALVKTLESQPDDYSLTNKLVIKQLRDLITSKTYVALKEDCDNQYVRFIHRITSALWNEVRVMSDYQKFGEAIFPKNEKIIGTDRAILEEGIRLTTKEFDSDQGFFGKIFYAIKDINQTIASAASEGGLLKIAAGAIPFIGDSIYDSHGKLSNNPFLQGTTHAKIHAENGVIQATINNCYGGSPTIDDSVSWEFEALAQLCENNQLASDKSYDKEIPSMLYFTNLQNIANKHAEGNRGAAIMDMQTRYPLSFYGMTLAKDSQFYKMGGHYSNGTWKGVDNVKWEGPKAFGKELKEAFTQPKCFQYGHRNEGESANGIYLPGSKAEWDKLLNVIIFQANKQLDNYQEELTGVAAAKLRGAYQEYVYTMIQSYTEMRLAKIVSKRAGRDILITSIRACKENIDRGGAENAKYLYARLPEKYDQKERTTLVSAALELRALLARNRKVIEDRIPQVLSFIEYFTPKNIQEDELDILEKLGITCEKMEFTPAFDIRETI